MSKSSEIKQLIRNIASNNEGMSLFEAEVSAVQDTTITVKYQGLLHENVRLVAGFSASNAVLIQKPKPGSMVLVADLSRGKMRDLIVLLQEQTDEIVINGGELGGLVKIEELTEKINGLVDTVNSLINAFNSHTHQVATTGSAAAQTGTAAAPATGAQTADKFKSSDYEDEKIRH